MSSFGEINDEDFQRFVKKVGDEAKTKHLLGLVDLRVSAMGNYLQDDVVKRSPVGSNSVIKGEQHKGGTLRRGWQVGPTKTDRYGVRKRVYNNTEYAPHVEYGHRIKNKKDGPTLGWYEGQHFFQKSKDDLDQEYSKGKWKKWIQGYFDQLNGR